MDDGAQPETSDSYLNSVAAAPDGTAWAVGWTGTNTSIRALLMRWNGAAWTTVPNPSPGGSYLYGVTAASDSGTAWAVGTANDKTLILRWNGTAWTRAPSPDAGREAISPA